MKVTKTLRVTTVAGMAFALGVLVARPSDESRLYETNGVSPKAIIENIEERVAASEFLEFERRMWAFHQILADFGLEVPQREPGGGIHVGAHLFAQGRSLRDAQDEWRFASTAMSPDHFLEDPVDRSRPGVIDLFVHREVTLPKTHFIRYVTTTEEVWDHEPPSDLLASSSIVVGRGNTLVVVAPDGTVKVMPTRFTVNEPLDDHVYAGLLAEYFRGVGQGLKRETRRDESKRTLVAVYDALRAYYLAYARGPTSLQDLQMACEAFPRGALGSDAALFDYAGRELHFAAESYYDIAVWTSGPNGIDEKGSGDDVYLGLKPPNER